MTRKVNSWGNIKQGWVPGGVVGWWWWGGFWPNILSILVLIEIRIRIKTRLLLLLLSHKLAQSTITKLFLPMNTYQLRKKDFYRKRYRQKEPEYYFFRYSKCTFQLFQIFDGSTMIFLCHWPYLTLIHKMMNNFLGNEIDYLSKQSAWNWHERIHPENSIFKMKNLCHKIYKKSPRCKISCAFFLPASKNH